MTTPEQRRAAIDAVRNRGSFFSTQDCIDYPNLAQERMEHAVTLADMLEEALGELAEANDVIAHLNVDHDEAVRLMNVEASLTRERDLLQHNLDRVTPILDAGGQLDRLRDAIREREWTPADQSCGDTRPYCIECYGSKPDTEGEHHVSDGFDGHAPDCTVPTLL